ncbi:TetR/AcrR family transcriptional regulator [Epibacterium ulvae]|uniref:TetR/AcrR family transcriptional regulator n=1 Tax=Epibacterium ulvae TaxID=1156985 RepID=UPI00248F67DD|nr:TetR/AcrR family transcriptional regulator [Epibacterium ulvae]
MPRPPIDRSEVIASIAEVFRKYGYDGASLGIIREETGYGRGSLYHFFPGGKEEMARAVISHIDAWFEEHIFQPLETQPPSDALTHMFDATDRYFQSGGRVCLVGAFALEQSRDRFCDEINDYFARWTKALSHCLVKDQWEQTAAKQAAAQTVALIQGGIVLTRATHDGFHFMAALLAAKSLCASPRSL